MSCPSDLSDAQWAVIEPFAERPDPRGAVRKHQMRTILDAIFYGVKTGCQWRALPKDFPPFAARSMIISAACASAARGNKSYSKSTSWRA